MGQASHNSPKKRIPNTISHINMLRVRTLSTRTRGLPGRSLHTTPTKWLHTPTTLTNSKSIGLYDLYGATHGEQSKKRPEQYKPEDWKRVGANGKGGVDSESAHSSPLPPRSQSNNSPPHPHSTVRSLLLSDAARVFMGISLVLQQSSHITATNVSQATRSWQSSKAHTDSFGQIKELIQDKMKGFTPTSSASSSSSSSFTPPPIPRDLRDVPKFVHQSVESAAHTAYQHFRPSQTTMSSSSTTSSSIPPFPSPSNLEDAARQVVDQANEVVRGVNAEVNRVATRVSEGVQSVSKKMEDIMQPKEEQNISTPTADITIATPSSGSTTASTSSQPPTPIEVVVVVPPSATSDGTPIETHVSVVSQNGIAQTTVPVTPTKEAGTSSTPSSASTTAASTSAPISSSSSSSTSSSSSSSSSSASSSSNFSTFDGGFKPRERTVPSTPLARIAGFSQIASSIFFGTIKDKVAGVFGKEESSKVNKNTTNQSVGSNSSSASSASAASDTSSASSSTRASGDTSTKGAVLGSFLSEANTERLAEGLCRMRGAALKVGQMLSIQDESLVPPQLQAVLDRVRDGADVMPRPQLERALLTELGPNWQDSLSEFDWTPMAAASIGQVHRARLKSNGQEVVMKVQYPGVAESINSDVNNLKRLIRFVNVLPKGMYIDETMRAAKEELALECDYTNEALAQKKFKKLAAGDPAFYVPQVIDSLSTKRILTTERVYGVAIDRLSPIGSKTTQPNGGSQHDRIMVSEEVRNNICNSLLRLCLNELFSYRFMQTDPNWSNFLYNPNNNLIYLIDFGASRLYRKQFVDEYLRMVYACSIRDREGIIESNIKLGFLTGDESKDMIDATVQAGYIIGEPFGSDLPYDFVEGNIAARVSALAGVMLRDRLTPPPKEAYTLHRKLSGAFLTCRKLEAKIQCKNDFLRVYRNHQFGPPLPLVFGSASKNPIESRLTPEI